jgi:hypothetical protein
MAGPDIVSANVAAQHSAAAMAARRILLASLSMGD